MGACHQAIRKGNPSTTALNSEAEIPAASSRLVGKGYAKLSELIQVVKDNRLRKILKMIQSHPSCDIHYLALECNLSESRLQHLFKQRTGLGLGQLLTEQRLLRASDFLVHTNMSIKEIATTIGYEHASSFTRAFERRFQQSPSCYRQTQISHTNATTHATVAVSG
jgi:transcriptional regulator GlxA family with amidase domain